MISITFTVLILMGFQEFKYMLGCKPVFSELSKFMWIVDCAFDKKNL